MTYCTTLRRNYKILPSPSIFYNRIASYYMMRYCMILYIVSFYVKLSHNFQLNMPVIRCNCIKYIWLWESLTFKLASYTREKIGQNKSRMLLNFDEMSNCVSYAHAKIENPFTFFTNSFIYDIILYLVYAKNFIFNK